MSAIRGIDDTSRGCKCLPPSRKVIRVQDGWRAVDIGCGPIGILNLLSERVGPKGVVIGLEREQRFVEMARVEIAKRGMGNVTMVQGDGLNTGLGKGSFDLVHERGWY